MDFDDTITTLADLREIIAPPNDVVLAKEIGETAATSSPDRRSSSSHPPMAPDRSTHPRRATRPDS